MLYSIYYVFNVIRHRLCSIYYIVYVTLYIYTHLHSVLHRQTNLCFVNKTCFASCFILSKKTCISSKKQCYKLGCISHTTKICKIKKVLHLGPLFLVTTCHHVLLQVRPIIVTSRAKSLLQVRPKSKKTIGFLVFFVKSVRKPLVFLIFIIKNIKNQRFFIVF